MIGWRSFTFKRQLKAYLFHIWCTGQQKKHPPPPGAVVAFFVILATDTKFRLTYLLDLKHQKNAFAAGASSSC